MPPIITTASGLPGGEGNLGKFYSQAWHDEQARIFAASKQGRRAQIVVDKYSNNPQVNNIVDNTHFEPWTNYDAQTVQPVNKSAGRVIADKNNDLNIDDPWTTQESTLPASILESNIFPGAKAASPIINDPIAGRSPWLHDDSAPQIPTGYQSIPIQSHIPEFEKFDQSYRQVSNNPPDAIPTGYQKESTQPHIPGFEKFDQSYRNVSTAPGQIPTTSPYYVEQAALPLETGHEQTELPLYSQTYDPTAQVPYEAFIKPQYGFFDSIRKGLSSGFDYSINSEEHPHAKSVVFERAPSYEYDYLPPSGQAAYFAGRIAGDAAGYGTKHFLWRTQPEDIAGTYSGKGIREAGGSRFANVVGPVAVTSAMALGSNIYNPFNLAQGGRPLGYAASSPDPNDPRESTAPIYDMAIEKGFLGHRGRLLPWEQFKQERPDVSYQQYSDYQSYLSNKDDNFLRNATLGIVKGDMNGVNGPEISIGGYSVTPMGAAAALGTYAAIRHGIGRVGMLTR